MTLQVRAVTKTCGWVQCIEW